MNKIIQIWVPFLVIAMGFVLLFDFSSVEKIPLDTAYDDRAENLTLRHPPTAPPVAPGVVSRLAVGQRYNSLEELVADQQAAGFVRIGYFGKHWPATVTEIAPDQDEIKFVRQGGTQHRYTGFDGHAMKMVRLMAGNRETIVVFRSESQK